MNAYDHVRMEMLDAVATGLIARVPPSAQAAARAELLGTFGIDTPVGPFPQEPALARRPPFPVPCESGRDGRPQDHEAEGYTVSPEGRPVMRQCRACSEEGAREYRKKLGEEWTFQPFEPAPGSPEAVQQAAETSVSFSWQNNPLAAVVRSLDTREAHAALAWAAEQDVEVDRLGTEILAEARAELALEKAAPELADALEALYSATVYYLYTPNVDRFEAQQRIDAAQVVASIVLRKAGRS
jgi:hypothetical protein